MPISDLNLILLFAALVFVGILVILCFILCMICLGKVHKIKKNTANTLTEETLFEYVDKIRESSSGEIGGTDPNAFCKSAIVKFNAFDDITGDYSFSFAMLNSFNNGIILTSLYGHNSCNTYIRKVQSGKCETFLLEEEKQALEAALTGKE